LNWHAHTPGRVLEALRSSAAGLTPEEAAERLHRHGRNELAARRRTSPWQLLLEQFKNVLIVTLLLATLLSAFLGHAVEAVAIAVIVLFAVILGFIQEYRAERAIEALKKMAAPHARVIRGGEEVTIPAALLVPGDLFLLAAGDRIPADGRLLSAVNLRVEEASLTGESVPSGKDAHQVLAEDVPLGDRKTIVFAGTSVAGGRGQAVATATGMGTEFGRIAALLEEVETEKTPLQKNLDRVGTLLARAAIVIVLAIVGLGLLRGQPLLEMFIFGIALAVAVVPEALPAVVTISLALGVQRMARRHALMRRLPAVETLGSTTVICSDKTGTLTRDEMTVKAVFTSGVSLEVGGSGYDPVGTYSAQPPGGPLPASLPDLLAAGALCNDARLVKNAEGAWDIVGDPTEGALLVAARKGDLDEADLTARHPRLDEVAFCSETKRMTTLHRDGSTTVAFVKGAPEVLLPVCDRILWGREARELDEEGRGGVLAAAADMAGRALRVLAVARKTGTTAADACGGLTLLGLVGMIDPPRPEAAAAVRTCLEAGIRPVMITGDHPDTAQAIARELGILAGGRVVTGPELEAMDDRQLREEVGDIQVFARVSPQHKLRIVGALQAEGQVVAMTGDGVNDAPALKKADIGISMGITGTDVTKEASAMMLTDDNFASIVAAVEEGRGIFDNIKKYLSYLLSSNIGEIGLMAGATLLGMPLPLSAVQILYVNLATDGLPALALAVDPAERNIMRRRPHDPRRGIFTRPLVVLMLAGGLWSTLVNLVLFQWASHSGRSAAEAMTMTFVSLVLIQFFKAYNFRSDRDPVYRTPFANRWLNLAIAWELVMLAVVIYLPVLHKPFGTFALPLEDWVVVLLGAVTVVPVLETTKWFIRRGWFGLGEGR
jgi:Ca2+-transporting ATPase